MFPLLSWGGGWNREKQNFFNYTHINWDFLYLICLSNFPCLERKKVKIWICVRRVWVVKMSNNSGKCSLMNEMSPNTCQADTSLLNLIFLSSSKDFGFTTVRQHRKAAFHLKTFCWRFLMLKTVHLNCKIFGKRNKRKYLELLRN